MKDFRLLLTIFFLFGGLFQAVGQSVPSYVPTNGLVGWWPFNGNAQDASGNGNHGTVNGATLTADRFGNQNKSYSFDGLDDFIEIPSSVSLNNPQGTINLWLYTTIPNRDVCPIKKTNFSNAGNEHYVISITPTEVVFANKYNSNCQSGNGWFRTATSNSIYTSPSWHMITATYSIVNNLYIDGILVSTSIPSSTNPDNCASDIQIGRGWSAVNEWVTGKIDDIGIWNRTLSQQEITLLYQNCQGFLTTQPSNQITAANRNAQFSVVSSEPNSTFRWQTNLGFGFQDLQNAGQYSGTQTSTLTVSNTSLQNDNQLFRCIVSTTHCGIDTSNVAILNVNSSSNSNNVPIKFNYQFVVRDTSGQLVSNRPVSMRLSLQRGPQMSNLYTETHQLTTNSNGLLTTTIGSGMPTHSSMDSLDWSLGDVFVKTEIDMNGGSNYSLVNTRELLSVPYALYSLNSGNSTPGPVGPMGHQGPAGATGPQGPQGATGQNAGPVFITPTNLFHKYGGWLNSWLDTIVVCDFDSILNLHPTSVIIQYQYVGNFTGNSQFFCKIDAATSGRIYNFCDIQNSIAGGAYISSYADQIITEQVIIPVSSNGLVDFDFYAAGMREIKLDLLGYFP
jgi:hypothetical protein